MQLTLYAKGNCHLCDEAKSVVDEVLADLAGQVDIRLDVVDITTDADLVRAYRYDIPVLAVDGRPAFRHNLTAARLRDRLLFGTPGPLEVAVR